MSRYGSNNLNPLYRFGQKQGQSPNQLGVMHGYMENDPNKPDNIYYNIEISNPIINPLVTENPPVVASYYENSTQTVLKNCSEYYMTIARFSIPGSSIPLRIVDIIDNQPDINLTPYIFCLSFNGNDFPVNVLFLTENFSVPLPDIPIPRQVITPYYYIYSYEHMIALFNIALDTSFTALKAAFPAAAPTVAPFFTYDPVTQLISLIVQDGYVVGSANYVQIFCNQILYKTFITSINAYFYGVNQLNGKDYQFVINLQQDNAWTYSAVPGPAFTVASPNYLPGVTPPFLIFTQEFKSLQNWNSMKSLVLVTGSIPIQSEYIQTGISNNIQTVTSTGFNFGSGAVSYKPIMTDFIPDVNLAGGFQENFIYNPTIYRLIDMIGAGLSKFDISIFWSDHDSNLYPIYLYTNEVASIKLLFIKK